MAQADAFDSTSHQRNLAALLRHALRLAERAGEEWDSCAQSGAPRRMLGRMAGRAAPASLV